MVNAATAKRDVQVIYAGIISQMVTDLEHPNPTAKELSMRLDVYDFLHSDWGKTVLDVLELDYETIDKRVKLTDKMDELHSFYRLVKLGITNDAIAQQMRINPVTVAKWRWDILGLRKHKGRKPEVSREEKLEAKRQHKREYQKEYYERTKARQPLGL